MATPCCPAPVSAITRALPIRSVSRGLAERVVDLVRAGVIEILAFEPNRRTTASLGQSTGEIERVRPPHIGRQQPVQFCDWKDVSRIANSYCAPSWSSAEMSVSGTYRPPNSPNRPWHPGSMRSRQFPVVAAMP